MLLTLLAKLFNFESLAFASHMPLRDCCSLPLLAANIATAISTVRFVIVLLKGKHPERFDVNDINHLSRDAYGLEIDTVS